MRNIKSAGTVAAIAAAAMLALTSCAAQPATCTINETSQETRIEIRNYKPGYSEWIHEMRPCLNANGGVDMCPYDAREWNPGSYQWRAVGDHADPEEGWNNGSGDPEKSTTGYSYIQHKENDTAVCDGREEFKDKDGKVINHNVTDTFYIAE